MQCRVIDTILLGSRDERLHSKPDVTWYEEKDEPFEARDRGKRDVRFQGKQKCSLEIINTELSLVKDTRFMELNLFFYFFAKIRRIFKLFSFNRRRIVTTLHT